MSIIILLITFLMLVNIRENCLQFVTNLESNLNYKHINKTKCYSNYYELVPI